MGSFVHRLASGVRVGRASSTAFASLGTALTTLLGTALTTLLGTALTTLLLIPLLDVLFDVRGTTCPLRTSCAPGTRRRSSPSPSLAESSPAWRRTGTSGSFTRSTPAGESTRRTGCPQASCR